MAYLWSEVCPAFLIFKYKFKINYSHDSGGVLVNLFIEDFIDNVIRLII